MARRQEGQFPQLWSQAPSLVGWIVVEVSIFRTSCWLQPTLLAAGLAVAVVGYQGLERLTPPSP